MALETVVPKEFKRHAHHWLILHGRYTCVARVPKCPECIVADLCRYPHKTVLSQTENVVAKSGVAGKIRKRGKAAS